MPTLITLHFPVLDCPSDNRDKNGHPTAKDLKGNYAINWGSWNFREQGGPVNGVAPLNLGDEQGPFAVFCQFWRTVRANHRRHEQHALLVRSVANALDPNAGHGLCRSPRPHLERRHLLLRIQHADQAEHPKGDFGYCDPTRKIPSGPAIRPAMACRRQRLQHVHRRPQPASQWRERFACATAARGLSATTSTWHVGRAEQHGGGRRRLGIFKRGLGVGNK